MRRGNSKSVGRGWESKALSLRGAKSALRIETPGLTPKGFCQDKLHRFATQSELLALGLRAHTSGGGNPKV